jgi:hypothetical protein
MSSSRPASAPGSAAAAFYAEERSALPRNAGAAVLFDPGHGRTSKTWAAVLASASHRWPELALAARAFVGG